MSDLPELATHQQLIGFAMPEWMVSPIPHAFRPLIVPDTDPLAAFMPGDILMTGANDAFESIIQTGIKITLRVDENVGKRGFSKKRLADQYWFSYLEGLSKEEQHDILWSARSSLRYQLALELYRNLPDKQSPLAIVTAEEIDVFARIDRYLAISIITDIADDLTKEKKQKKKIPVIQLLDELLIEKGIDAKEMKTLIALAKKTPMFKKEEKKIKMILHL